MVNKLDNLEEVEKGTTVPSETEAENGVPKKEKKEGDKSKVAQNADDEGKINKKEGGKEKVNAKKTEKGAQRSKKSSKKGKVEGSVDDDVIPLTPKQESSKFKYIIANRAVKRHTRKRALALVMLIFMAITMVLGAAVYGISLMVQHNNLKILIDRPGANVFSLSSTEQFYSGAEVLSLGGPRYMDNVSLIDFYPIVKDIRNAEGAYQTENAKFLGATFYFKNLTDRQQIYTEAVVLQDVTQDLDDAMRVMFIKEKAGEVTETVYAKAVPNGETAYDESATREEVCPGQWFAPGGKFTSKPEDIWMTQPFSSPRYAFYNTQNKIEPGEVVKYSIIVWLEGWDKDCIDARLGGTIRLELQFIQA